MRLVQFPVDVCEGGSAGRTAELVGDPAPRYNSVIALDLDAIEFCFRGDGGLAVVGHHSGETTTLKVPYEAFIVVWVGKGELMVIDHASVVKESLSTVGGGLAEVLRSGVNRG